MTINQTQAQSAPFTRRLAVMALPLTLFLGGCAVTDFFTGGNNDAPPPLPVGIYVSTDRGETWNTSNRVFTSNPNSNPTLNSVNVKLLKRDATDRQTFYLGSERRGLFYSYNEAKGWWQSGPIRQGTLNDVITTFDPDKRCTLFLARNKEILRSNDCGRFWEQVYLDARGSVKVLKMAAHATDANIVYAALSTGDIIWSKDAGESWQARGKLKGAVTHLFTFAGLPDVMYAVLRGKGLWVSEDGGENWVAQNDNLKKFKGALTIKDIKFHPEKNEYIIVATNYGLLRSRDAGVTWEAYELLTPPGKANISSVAFNESNEEQIYYSTGTTFYRSVDDGVTWETLPMPVTQARSILFTDPKRANVLYIGFFRERQQQQESIF